MRLHQGHFARDKQCCPPREGEQGLRGSSKRRSTCIHRIHMGTSRLDQHTETHHRNTSTASKRIERGTSGSFLSQRPIEARQPDCIRFGGVLAHYPVWTELLHWSQLPFPPGTEDRSKLASQAGGGMRFRQRTNRSICELQERRKPLHELVDDSTTHGQ